MTSSCLLLSTCLAFAVVCHVTGRSVLLKRLAAIENEVNYRQLADYIRLQERAEKRPNVDATGFLERFGYLHELPPGVGHDPADRATAVRNFQRMYHLRQSGQLDEETVQAMMAPRCGMPDTKPTTYTDPTDIAKRYFVPGSYKWHKTDLTYRFMDFAGTPTFTADAKKHAILRAFNTWSEVSPLTFTETQQKGDLNLKFTTADHGDGAGNRFDGPGGVLAHAFYPENGETHFDNEEMWVDRQKEGIDLTTVAAHELGHALGLGHSDKSGALMAPYYQGYDPNFTLPDDDIEAIQSLYGPRPSSGGNPPVTKKATTTPTTTTTTTTPVTPAMNPNGEPDSCSVEFKAATQIHDNSIVVFNGAWVWRLTASGLDDGFPNPTRDLFPFAPSSVDAAVFSRRTMYTYLFYGRSVWKYHGFELIKGSSIATASFAGSVTDAVTNASGEIYLIKGSSCWQFDEMALAVFSSPRTCSSIFPTMPTNVDSTMRLLTEPNYIYLFKGANYSKYNDITKRVEGSQKDKAGPWMGAVCGGNAFAPK